MKKIKLKWNDCTMLKKPHKSHRKKKKRTTVYYCERKGCSWYMVPTLSPSECVIVELDAGQDKAIHDNTNRRS